MRTKAMKMIILFTMLCMVMVSVVQASGKSQTNIEINGKRSVIESINSDNVIMAPISLFQEALNMDVVWNASSKTITATLDGRTVVMTIGLSSATFTENSTSLTYKMDQPPLLRDQRAWIPVRFVSELLGLQVGWVQSTNTIKISSAPSDGLQGPQGEQGPPGPKGDTGAAGPQGSSGSSGSQGPKGDTGATGPAGSDGAIGPAGPAGPQGDPGPIGPIGPAGADGATGPAGPQGDPGPVGPIGPAGADGATGPAGPQGDPGTVGPAGAIGPAGPQGDPGSVGPTGAIGPAGPQGDPGPTGPQGPAGTGGVSAILPFSSGDAINLTTILGGLKGTGAILGFGSSASGVTFTGSTIDLTTSKNYAFSMPSSGTLTSLSAFFSTSQALTLVGTTINVSAQLYEASAGNTFIPVPGSEVTLIPSYTGIITKDSTAQGVSGPLSIPVTQGSRYILVFSSTASGLGLINTIAGFASAGISISSN